MEGMFMDLFTREDLQALLRGGAPPCLSLYIPTQRGGGEADPVRWRKALAAAREQLVQRGLRGPEAAEVLAPARALLEDSAFWKSQGDGLAFFLGRGFVRRYRLPLLLPEHVAVGTRFVVTPLLPLLAGDGRFFILSLSQNGVRLLQGTRQTVSPLDLRGVPANLAEALGAHDVDEPLLFHTQPALGLGRKGAIFHGHGVGIDDAKDDLLRYFQKVDRALQPLLAEQKAPLVLAAVNYLLPLYRQASSYPHLLSEAIAGNPDRLSEQELHQRAWPLVEPYFRHAQEKALALYEQLAGTGRTVRGVQQGVPAACRGEVEVLFVARDRSVWGVVDPASGEVVQHEQPAPGDEDLLNLAAASTLRHRGTVHVLSAEQMPGGALLAGIRWLPLPRHDG
jgi:hypothetical protein